MSNTAEDLDFSKPIKIDDISKKQAMHEKINMTPEQGAALAKRLDILNVSEFTGLIKINRKKGHLIVIEGTCDVKYQQECVVSLKPLDKECTFTFTTFFTENEIQFEQDEDMAYIQPSDDDKRPEQVIDGKIDIADTAVQYFALEIDPYSKAPDADFDKSADAVGLKHEKENPFAVLATLKEDK